MKPFSPDSKCAKCGHSDLNLKWHTYESRQGTKLVYTEALQITCPRCGYKWDEAPLDQPRELGFLKGTVTYPKCDLCGKTIGLDDDFNWHTAEGIHPSGTKYRVCSKCENERENEPGCEYCRDGKEYPTPLGKLWMGSDDEGTILFVRTSDSERTVYNFRVDNISFCPFCGTKLDGDEE